MSVIGYLGRFGGDSIDVLCGEPGALSVHFGVAATNASYLAMSPDARVVYAAMEHQDRGAVGAFAVDGEGLQPMSVRPTGGVGTCHVSVHSGYVLAADYGSGSVTVFPVGPNGDVGEQSDRVEHAGAGPNRDRQSSPHAHMAIGEPTSECLFAVDLGTDTVYRYALCAGRLTPAGAVSMVPGAGPRHLAYHPVRRIAYVANELDSTVTVLDLEALSRSPAVSTAPSSAASESFPSAIRVSFDGRRCYVANRGVDTIATLSITPDGMGVRLVDTTPAGGRLPWDLVVRDGTLYSVNLQSGSLSTFQIDSSGRPVSHGDPIDVGPAPSSLLLR